MSEDGGQSLSGEFLILEKSSSNNNNDDDDDDDDEFSFQEVVIVE